MTSLTAERLRTQLGTNPDIIARDSVKTHDYGSFLLRVSQQPSRKPYRLGNGVPILHDVWVGRLSAHYGHPSNIPIQTPDTLVNPKNAYGMYLRSTQETEQALDIRDRHHTQPVELVGSAMFVPSHLAEETVRLLGDREGCNPTGTIIERLTRSLNGRVELPRHCGAVILYGTDIAEAIIFNDEASVLPIRD